MLLLSIQKDFQNIVILILGLISLIIPHSSINQLYSINYVDKIIGFLVALSLLLLFLVLEKVLNK